MHILFFAFYFPPFNTMGAVRTGKTAKYLEQMGHDLSVVSAGPQLFPITVPLEIPRRHVTYTPWIGHPRLKQAGAGDTTAAGGEKRARHKAEGRPAAQEGAGARRLKALARRAYLAAMMPDQQIGWYPYALRAAREATRRERPDVVFASAGPVTCLLLGRRVARELGIPWVAELRDPWMDNPHRETFVVRDVFERRLERRVLSSADGLVTVSPAIARTLEAKLQRRVEVIYNGYEPSGEAPATMDPSPTLVIRYTGSIWEDRLPPMLFEHLARLPVDAPVRVEFYGRNLDTIRRLAAQTGAGRVVHCLGEVPYEESLRLQRKADVLLMTMADTPAERETITGKIFEYMNARRPIMLLGCPDGAAAELVRSSGCGVVISDEGGLTAQFEDWLALKRQTGRIPPTPPPPAQYTRAEQTRKLAAVLERAARRS